MIASFIGQREDHTHRVDIHELESCEKDCLRLTQYYDDSHRDAMEQVRFVLRCCCCLRRRCCLDANSVLF